MQFNAINSEKPLLCRLRRSKAAFQKFPYIITIIAYTRDDILYLLRRLSSLAKAEGVTLEVAFFGGSCLLLAYDEAS